MKKSTEEIIALAKSMGIDLKIDPTLAEKYRNKPSKKLEEANKVISRLRMPS